MTLETCRELQQLHARCANECRMWRMNSSGETRAWWLERERAAVETSRSWIRTMLLMLEEDQPYWGAGHGGEG